MNLTAYIDYLIAWLEEQRRDLYHLDGYTLGVSGGVDSAVCAQPSSPAPAARCTR